MTSDLTALEQFRQSLYSLFPKRQDSLMNLIDANTSFGHQCRSVVELSTAPCFERQYSSITDAISDGASKISWPDITSLLQKSVQEKSDDALRKFVLDCTPNPRPFSKTLSDRTVTHAPNPAPGNKPIAVGHQYSALVQLPCDKLAAQKHWVIPMDVKRVKSTEKGNEAGMLQLIEHLKQSQLTEELTLSIGDSLYGTEACRIAAGEQDNLIHLFRLNSQRNVFLQPTAEETASSVGRKKVFGKKIPLSQPGLYPPCEAQAQTTWASAKGRAYQVAIECWKNVLLRGSTKFRSEKHPINLLKITVTDDEGKALFKRPLILAVFGKRRHELALVEAYESYHSRYDIEHFFRFGKQKLLMDAYQTPSVEHEEAWWMLCLISYHQLYLARLLTNATPYPWEKYLPAYQTDAQTTIVTPTQAQRGFANLLEKIGSPARFCVARGRLSGRLVGMTQEKRAQESIQFKAKKKATPPTISQLKTFISRLEKSTINSCPEKLDDMVSLVQTLLKRSDYSAQEFIEMLNNSS